QATEAYETGGAKALAAYLARLDRIFHAAHFFVDTAGKDLVTGEDRSAMLALSPERTRIPHLAAGLARYLVRPTGHGRYRRRMRGSALRRSWPGPRPTAMPPWRDCARRSIVSPAWSARC